MAWPETGAMAALLLIPLVAAHGLWLRRLWPRFEGAPGLGVAAAVLGLVPSTAGALLLFESTTGALAPVSVPVGAFLLGIVALLGVGIAYLLDRTLAYRSAEWVLALVLGLPLLAVLASMLGPMVEPSGLYAWGGFQPLLALSALALGALAPWLVARWNQRGARWDKINAAALVALLVPIGFASGVVLLVSVSTGSPGPAEYAWSVQVDPVGEDAAWTVEAPFLASPEEASSRSPAIVLEALRTRTHVTQGTAELSWQANETRLQITGTGPVTITSSYAFFGDKEAFRSFRVPLAHASSSVQSEADVTLAWAVSFEGEPCFADTRHEVSLAPGASRAITADASDTGEWLPHRPWSVACV